MNLPLAAFKLKLNDLVSVACIYTQKQSVEMYTNELVFWCVWDADSFAGDFSIMKKMFCTQTKNNCIDFDPRVHNEHAIENTN